MQPNIHWKALNEIYKFYDLLETKIFKISILKRFKNLQILKTLLKNASFERKMHFLEKKMQFFTTENGEKSDSVNHIPNLL